ncbi:MAG: heavy metal translocating P-type ATPase metal-binding domain-containing protein [Myxococcales bacterium]|nr:heavy metal translocating P-type ATPase metal-binding domain-containing protein [Myxococcales bacterium]
MTTSHTALDLQLAQSPSRATARCVHCGQPAGAEPVFASDGEGPFCCRGCRAVRRVLIAGGLGRYYELRRGRGVPAIDPSSTVRSRAWLEPLEAELDAAGAAGAVAAPAQHRIGLDVAGIHCAGCVWLLEETFRRQAAGGQILVNPSLGHVDLHVDGAFPLRAWVESIESLGYELGPARAEPAARDRSPSDGLLLRAAVCIALASNSMIFAAAIYFGLREGPLFDLFNQLGYAAAVLAVFIGAPVFVRAAAQGLRRGVLHLDLPIAVGIVLAFAATSWDYFAGSGRAAYFDTLTVFIALMLLGRWVQQRAIDRNRRRLLDDGGVESLVTRRARDGRVDLVRCTDIAAGDALVIAPGELIPVAATLESDAASCSLDWIDGESAPRRFDRGDTLPAGAFNLGRSALRAEAQTAFDASSLVRLLRPAAVSPRSSDEREGTPFWRRVSALYVTGVLATATAGVVGWLLGTGDVARALEVGTAVLIVSCPCAFGLATPLAYELVLARLRRAGLFVRSGGFLDRARGVTRVVFDKTGTLTTGTPRLRDPSSLAALDAADRAALYAVASLSAHPKSVAVRRALDDAGEAAGAAAATLDAGDVEEHPGLGLRARIGGRVVALGAPRWVGAGDCANDCAEDVDLAFAIDGRTRLCLATEEAVRPGAREEVSALRRAGYQVTVLSGDAPDRVRSVAAAIGLDADAATGAASPDDKAAWIAAHDPERTLFVGDGLNDGLAADRAGCAGTPAVDRPFMASRCDFYFASPGLGPILDALRSARALSRTVRLNLAIAVAYNAFAVSLALCGLMKPWLAAVLMPLSSVLTLAVTAASLSEGRAAWRS